MLTPRGYWLLLTAVVLLAAGGFQFASFTPVPALVGLTLLIWLGLEWIQFTRQVHVAQQTQVTRVLVQANRPAPVVWAGIPFTVQLTLTTPRPLDSFQLVDFRPLDLPAAEDFTTRTKLEANSPTVLEYSVTATGPGVIRFEAVNLIVSDRSGLFQTRRLHRQPREIYALPASMPVNVAARTPKNENALPGAGMHRLRRPGSGDELLDLREYQPGDEPKMIAWKVSARRDMLMSRVIESDVPMRCVVFVDTSRAARTGPPGDTPASHLAAQAAAVLQAVARTRDFTGLTLFDDDRFTALRPARTRFHQLNVLQTLTRAAAAPLIAPTLTIAQALEQTLPLAERLYPDLVSRSRNSLPLGLFWRPVADSYWFLFVVLLLALPVLVGVISGGVLLESAAALATSVAPSGWAWFGLFLLLVLAPAAAGLVWLIHGIIGFVPGIAARTRARKRLGLLFAHLDHASPALVERVIHDDAELQKRCAEFLARHRVRGSEAISPDPGAKWNHLASGLARAVGAARDTELYVIFAHLNPAETDLAALRDAVIVARARKHQVVFLVPSVGETADEPPGLLPGRLSLRAVVDRHAATHWAATRRTLTHAGATVVRVGPADAPRLVLERLDRVRGRKGRR